MNRSLVGVSANLAALVGLVVTAAITSESYASHGGCRRHAVPIKLTAHISSDGSGELRLSGVGSHLGRFTGRGTINSFNFDPVTNQIEVGVTATFVARDGDRLFASVLVSVEPASGRGAKSLTFTGGTGRFAGCSGSASGNCETELNPASPLTFECDSQTSGTLILVR